MASMQAWPRKRAKSTSPGKRPAPDEGPSPAVANDDDGPAPRTDAATTTAAAADCNFFCNPDITLEILGKLGCRLSLRRMAATSREFRDLISHPDRPGSLCAEIWAHAWLHLDETTAAAILCRVPAGERVMLRAGTALRGVIHVAQPIHLKAEEGVTLVGQLRLEDGNMGPSRAQGSSHQDDCYLWNDGDFQVFPWRGTSRHDTTRGHAVGILEGISVSHYMEPAICVRGGTWQVLQCETGTSKRGARASTSIDMREGTSLSLLGCTIRQALHAVCVERSCTLEAIECTFTNNKEAVVTRGGGGASVVVELCTFTRNEIALKLDDACRGRATGNTLEAGSMFGPWEKPGRFRVVANHYAAGVVNEDVEEPDFAAVAAAEAAAAAEEAEAQAAAAAEAEALAQMEAEAEALRQEQHLFLLHRQHEQYRKQQQRHGGGGGGGSSSSLLAPPPKRRAPKYGVEHGYWRCLDDPDMRGTCTREHLLR